MKCIRKRKIKEKKQETSRHTSHALDIFGLTVNRPACDELTSGLKSGNIRSRYHRYPLNPIPIHCTNDIDPRRIRSADCG